MKHVKPKIIFAGLAQNCAPFLTATLKNIENMTNLASEAAYIFLENDSKDSTQQDLLDWGANKENFKFINLDGLNTMPARSMRLEFLRNTYIEVIKADNDLKSFDILIIIDMDDVSTFLMNLEQLERAIEYLNSENSIAAVFPNQLGIYYDMWALRHPELCPMDIWEEVFNFVADNKCSDKEAFEKTFAKRIFSIDVNREPIEVKSAFGGLGIYKMQYVLKNPNPYVGVKIQVLRTSPRIEICRWQLLEHAHFHEGIRSIGGKLYVLPYLINGDHTGMTFPESGFRMMLF